MFLKLLIISVCLVAIIMLALGIKLLFDPKAEFTVHSCNLDKGNTNSDGTCYKCQSTDPADCTDQNVRKRSLL